VVSATDLHGRILGFLDPEPLLFHSSSSSIILTRLSGTSSRTTTSKKNLVVPGIEPGPLDLYSETLTTRPQRRSTCLSNVNIITQQNNLAYLTYYTLMTLMLRGTTFSLHDAHNAIFSCTSAITLGSLTCSHSEDIQI
jgi:hypothetical protein